MKVFALICALLVVGAYAEPVKVVGKATPSHRRDIIEILADVANAFADFILRIDPVKVSYYQINFEILNLINAGISIDNFAVSGFSEIDISRFEYNDGILSLDFALVDVFFTSDLIRLYVGSATGEIKGSFDVKNLGFSLDFDLDDEDGVSVSDFRLVLNEPIFEAHVEANALGQDYTDVVMRFFNVGLPSWLHKNGERIGYIIRFVIVGIINSVRETI